MIRWHPDWRELAAIWGLVKCSNCGLLGRKHPASGDHQFTPEKLRAVK